MSELKSIERWSEDDVGGWLIKTGFGEYVQKFKDNKINGKSLLLLEPDDSKELGIRKEVLEKIQLKLNPVSNKSGGDIGAGIKIIENTPTQADIDMRVQKVYVVPYYGTSLKDIQIMVQKFEEKKGLVTKMFNLKRDQNKELKKTLGFMNFNHFNELLYPFFTVDDETSTKIWIADGGILVYMAPAIGIDPRGRIPGKIMKKSKKSYIKETGWRPLSADTKGCDPETSKILKILCQGTVIPRAFADWKDGVAHGEVHSVELITKMEKFELAYKAAAIVLYEMTDQPNSYDKHRIRVLMINEPEGFKPTGGKNLREPGDPTEVPLQTALRQFKSETFGVPEQLGFFSEDQVQIDVTKALYVNLSKYIVFLVPLKKPDLNNEIPLEHWKQSNSTDEASTNNPLDWIDINNINQTSGTFKSETLKGDQHLANFSKHIIKFIKKNRDELFVPGTALKTTTTTTTTSPESLVDTLGQLKIH